jgi:hypothetical protein
MLVMCGGKHPKYVCSDAVAQALGHAYHITIVRGMISVDSLT